MNPETAAGARTSHRAWVEIDHAAIADNVAALRGLGRPGQQVIGVVKANAYGHGDAETARTLVAAGVERLAVATVDEGIGLRDAGIESPVVVLFEMSDAEAPRAVAAGLEATVFTARGVVAIARAAASAGSRGRVHLKIDTGLGRQGVHPSEALGVAREIITQGELELVGTYTHLAVPGEDEAFTDLQLVRLGRALDSLRGSGLHPGLVHVSGTGGVLAGVAPFADAIRPGLGLYGLAPRWASARAA
ncbi:MAG: alanine racemase, partial [Chloroflexota bacterium]|nr:alanine racemase [Chloroflexota bacterium]